MIKNILIFLVFVAVALWYGFSRDKISIPAFTPTEPGEQITYTKASTDLITIELPSTGAVTGKEFSVIGKARGFWFFEASFPIQVLDKNGNVLVNTFATAEGEWMTESFVPFKVTIKAPETYTGQATLVLLKDNASGLPEHDASVSFPITIEH